MSRDTIYKRGVFKYRGIRLNVDLDSLLKMLAYQKQESINAIARKAIEEYVEKHMPDDYKKYQEFQDNQKTEAITIWTTTKARLFNDDPKAEFVEYSNATKNYYKDWWRRKWNSPFMSWKWSGFFRKTKFFLENN